MGLIMLLCGSRRMRTSIGLEVLFGQNGGLQHMLFNFQGGICLEGLLIFIGGLFFIYLIAPRSTACFNHVSQKAKMYLCTALSFLFVVNLIHHSCPPNMGFRNHGVTVYLTSISPCFSDGRRNRQFCSYFFFAVALLLITTGCLPRVIDESCRRIHDERRPPMMSVSASLVPRMLLSTVQRSGFLHIAPHPALLPPRGSGNSFGFFTCRPHHRTCRISGSNCRILTCSSARSCPLPPGEVRQYSG